MAGPALNVSVDITVQAGVLPTLAIASLAQAKQNSGRKLSLMGSAYVSGVRATLEDLLSYEWSVSQPAGLTTPLPDLTSPAVTATGVHKENLVLLPSTLPAGGEYTFRFSARTYDGRTAVEPAAGRALLHDHQILHEVPPIEAGVKYVVRTDIMYARVPD